MKKFFKIFALVLGIAILTVSATACGETAGKSVSSIILSGAKKTFTVGEEFSLGEIAVIAIYEDKTESEIDDYEVDSSEFDPSKEGSYDITIKYGKAKKTYTVSVVQKWKEDKKLKILTIGNSFSDDSMQWLYEIATNAGSEDIEEVWLGQLYIGGCSIDTHLNNIGFDKPAYQYRTRNSTTKNGWKTEDNYKMKDAILSEEWDYISFQQASGFSGKPESYENLSALMEKVRELAPDASFVWHMTWAYQDGSTNPDIRDNYSKSYNSDQLTMYRAIVNAVKSEIIPKKEFVRIIPSGTAIQNARTSYKGDNLNRDGYHLTLDLGRYIAGLTFFEKLTGIPASQTTYAPNGLTEKDVLMAKESASNAIRTPFEVTQSSYTAE